jgi:hypothetical protein
MKDWYNKLFTTNAPLGDRLFQIGILIIAVIFSVSLILMILSYFIYNIYNCVKWIYKKLGYPNYYLDHKVEDFFHKIKKRFQTHSNSAFYWSGSFLFFDKQKLQLLKSISLGILIPVLGIILFAFSSISPIIKFPSSDIALLTRGKPGKGYITKIKQQFGDILNETTNEYESEFFYLIKYSFSLPSGDKIYITEKREGEIPKTLEKIKIYPYEVDIKYLVDNPKISKIIGFENGNEKIWVWFKKFLLVVGTMLLLIFWSFTIIKKGLRNYKTIQNE